MLDAPQAAPKNAWSPSAASSAMAELLPWLTTSSPAAGRAWFRQLPGQGSCSCDWARGVSDRLAIRCGGPQLRAVDPWGV